MGAYDRLRSAVSRATSRLRFGASSQRQPPAVGGDPPAGYGVPLVNAQAERRASTEDALEGRVAVNAGPMSDRISTRSGSNLDPAKIDRIFQSADLGVAIYQYADLCKQMRERDSHLMGIDRQRRQGVANKDFLIWPQSDNDPVSVGLSHAMRSAVDGIDGLPSAIYSAHSKNCDGWSLSEICWRRDSIRFQIPDGNGGGPLVTVPGLWPRSIYWVHAKHTEFAQGSSDTPLLNIGSEGAIRLPRHKFIYSMTPGDGIASARGYSRAVVWMHFFKHASIRDWNVFLHLYGIPWMKGTTTRELWKDAAMKAVLRLAIQAYGTGDEAPILPEGLDIVVKDPVSMGGAGDAHKALAGFCNAEQSKAVLGETLTTEAGESGSYKLGNVHQDSAHDVIVGDALTTASDLRADLMLSAIELNAKAIARAFEENGIKCLPEDLPRAIPRCGFRTDREWSPNQRLEIFTKAAEAGVKVSKSQVRRELQLDPPTSPDDEMRGKPIAVSAGGAAVGSADASEGVSVPKPETEPAPKGA